MHIYKNSKGFLWIIFIAITLSLTSFRFIANATKVEKTILLEEKTYLNQEVKSVYKSFAELDAIAEMYRKDEADLNTFKSALSKARNQYKRIEFYLAFHFPEFVKKHINGAPLLHLELENARSVVDPEGLQVLDELAYAEESTYNKQKIYEVSKKLFGNMYAFQQKNAILNVEDDAEIETLRLQLVRIFSSGVTGFDTPGSLNGLPESKSSLQGMQDYFTKAYSKTKETEAFNEVNKLFKGAVEYLDKNQSFEDFDRLTFLKQYIDPLYKSLKAFKSKNAATKLTYITSWNSDSESLFASDFLNPYAFTLLKKEEDSEALKLLGEQLFYDANISGNGKMSCATCHQPNKGFTDGMPKSMSSVEGKTVLRNSPTLLNAVFADRYFYDLRAYTLEQQAEHVIFNPHEFNTAYSAILQKIGDDKDYQNSFKKVFGNKAEINRANFAKALASYVLSLQSFNSEFDKYVRGEVKNIPDGVKRGFNLFAGKANCATCHFTPTFSGLVPPMYTENESEILGVLADSKKQPYQLDDDLGRIENDVNTEKAWIYSRSFKTTTVRNVALTAPYFHNGAYKTLEDVVDFYNDGGGAGLGLSVSNQTLSDEPLDLTDQEKKDLISFMEYLTDNTAGEKQMKKKL